MKKIINKINALFLTQPSPQSKRVAWTSFCTGGAFITNGLMRFLYVRLKLDNEILIRNDDDYSFYEDILEQIHKVEFQNAGPDCNINFINSS